MLTVPENVVDDRGVGAGVQEHPLLFVLDVVHGEGAVPSELPSHGLEDKGKTSKKLQCVQPELGLQTLPPSCHRSGHKSGTQTMACGCPKGYYEE